MIFQPTHDNLTEKIYDFSYILSILPQICCILKLCFPIVSHHSQFLIASCFSISQKVGSHSLVVNEDGRAVLLVLVPDLPLKGDHSVIGRSVVLIPEQTGVPLVCAVIVNV